MKWLKFVGSPLASYSLAVITLSCLSCACHSKKAPEKNLSSEPGQKYLKSAPLTPSISNPSPTLFKLLDPSETGVDGGDSFSAGGTVGDIDGDGDSALDLFIAQGAGTADQLLLRRGDHLVNKIQQQLSTDASGESIAPILFDVEGDIDLDGDGIPDLVLAQNFFLPQRETGRMDGSLSFVLLGNGDGSFRVLSPSESDVYLSGDARSLSVLDYTGNNQPDLLFARNSASPQLYFNNAKGYFLKIQLVSKHPANVQGIGCYITLHYKDQKTQSCEIHAGNGYLSQSPNEIFISEIEKNKILKATVRWPDGTQSDYLPPKNASSLIWELKHDALDVK